MCIPIMSCTLCAYLMGFSSSPWLFVTTNPSATNEKKQGEFQLVCAYKFYRTGYKSIVQLCTSITLCILLTKLYFCNCFLGKKLIVLEGGGEDTLAIRLILTNSWLFLLYIHKPRWFLYSDSFVMYAASAVSNKMCKHHEVCVFVCGIYVYCSS